MPTVKQTGFHLHLAIYWLKVRQKEIHSPMVILKEIPKLMG